MMIKFIDMLIKEGDLDWHKREVYLYALRIRLEQFITYCILLLVSFVYHDVIGGMIYAISFFILRKATGGFHAETFLGCLFGTSIIFLFTLQMVIPVLSSCPMLEVVGLILAGACVVKLAPVNHPNLLLTSIEIENHRKWARCLYGVEILVIVIGAIFRMSWQQYIASGVMTCAVFIIIAKFTGQEVTKDERS